MKKDMKIARYELKVVYKKELILMMEDDVDSEDLLKIFLETQLKEEKEQSELLGIIAEKVSEESCTEQCESCQKYCPASEECMARLVPVLSLSRKKSGKPNRRAAAKHTICRLVRLKATFVLTLDKSLGTGTYAK